MASIIAEFVVLCCLWLQFALIALLFLTEGVTSIYACTGLLCFYVHMALVGCML